MSWRGYLSRNVRRVVFLVDQKQWSKGGNCYGVREWFGKNFKTLDSMNPHANIYLRSLDRVRPTLTVAYDGEVEKHHDVAHLKPDEIDEVLRKAVEDGESMPRMKYPSLAPFRMHKIPIV